MIIPIGHERESVRRLPWVTFGLIALCLLAHVATRSSNAPFAAEEALDAAFEYWLERPWLDLDPRLEAMAFQGVPSAQREELLAMFEVPGARPADAAAIAEQQEELDRRTARGLELLDGMALRRFGLVPARPDAVSWLSHMFLHAGWLHLLGNLLILYLAGPFIEDVWGRPLFLAFYLVAGLVAAAAFVVREPGSTVPLVGASGAIAGVMGAFLVRYRTTQIRFFYFFAWFVRGVFEAPAWLMLPMWFCEQLFMAFLTDGAGAGVAYWAHVGGFGFGLVAALGVRRLRVEERWIEPSLRRCLSTTVLDNRRVEEAMAALDQGRQDHAWDLLREEARARPDNADAVVALWTLAGETGRRSEAVPLMTELVRRELRSGREDLATRHWDDLAAAGASIGADPDLMVRLARALRRTGRVGDALRLLRSALLSVGGGTTAALALRVAAEARELDPGLARGAARTALGTAGLDPLEAARAREILAAADRIEAAEPVELPFAEPGGGGPGATKPQ